jgi:hypothetical protein
MATKAVGNLKLEVKILKARAKQYMRGFNILMDYWDSISDEEKQKADKRLKKLNL